MPKTASQTTRSNAISTRSGQMMPNSRSGKRRVLFSICVSSEAAADIQEDRRKVPWSDKETIILLEIWGDPQVRHNVPFNCDTSGSNVFFMYHVAFSSNSVANFRKKNFPPRLGPAEHKALPAQRPHLHRNIRETGCQRLLPQCRAVPFQDQTAESQLSAVSGKHEVRAPHECSLCELRGGLDAR